MSRPDPVVEALLASRENKRIEFKEQFSAAEPGAWCELIKDIAALANSGGGVLVIGLDSAGKPSGWDPSQFLGTDPADITNLFAKYTGDQFDGFAISEGRKGGKRVAAIKIGPKGVSPLVFEKPGTYSIGPSLQKTAFSRGTTYFRHGAKSEPAVSADLARFIRSELLRQRRELLANVRKLSLAPRDSKVIVVSPKSGPEETINKFRVVDDPSAPAVARTDYDVTHPYRQKELIATINDRLGEKLVGPYEILSLRRTYKIDERPEFFHRHKFSGSPQFSDALVSWLMTEYQSDNDFFAKAVERYSASRKSEAGS